MFSFKTRKGRRTNLYLKTFVGRPLTIFVYTNAPWAMHFSKGVTTITDKKNQLSSPVAMGNNGHVLP